MAVKDWLPVAQDIYDTLIVADGNPIQGKTLKISHKDLCEILDKHSIVVTEAMNRPISKIEETPYLVYVIKTTVQYKDLSKSLYDNGLFKSCLTGDEERSAFSSPYFPRSLWAYQIAHRLQLAFGDPKAKEEAIKNEEEKENINDNDIEVIEDEIGISEEEASLKNILDPLENTSENEEFVEVEDEPSDYPKINIGKTDYDKIICKLGAIKSAIGVVSLDDVVKVIGEEMIPNVRGKDSFTQIIPGDPRFINVLDIMNKIVSAISFNYQDSNLVSTLKGLLSDLEKIIRSLDSKPNQNDTEKCNKVCDYLLALKSKSFTSLECLTIPAFFDVLVKFDVIESDEQILKKLQENPMTNVVFFELIKSVKTLEGKPTENWYESTSRLVLQFKSFYNLAKAATKFSFPNAMTINPLYGTSFGKANAKAKDIPGIDPRIYQKAAAFDRIVDALRPVFIELEKQKPLMQGFGSPFNGWGNTSL